MEQIKLAQVVNVHRQGYYLGNISFDQRKSLSTFYHIGINTLDYNTLFKDPTICCTHQYPDNSHPMGTTHKNENFWLRTNNDFDCKMFNNISIHQ